MRELTDKDIALCLFLAQIEVGIYIAWDRGRRAAYNVITGKAEYYALRPRTYFGMTMSDILVQARTEALTEINQGPEPIIYRLSPEFRNQPNYQEYMVL